MSDKNDNNDNNRYKTVNEYYNDVNIYTKPIGYKNINSNSIKNIKKF